MKPAEREGRGVEARDQPLEEFVSTPVASEEQASSATGTNDMHPSFEEALDRAERDVMRLRTSALSSEQPLAPNVLQELDETIQIWQTASANQALQPERRSRLFSLLGHSLSIRKIIQKKNNLDTGVEDMVHAIKAFVECLVISNTHPNDTISARLLPLIKEINALRNETNAKEPFEEITGPLDNLRINRPEVDDNRRWLVALWNFHIMRYECSDFEAFDSLDEALDVLSLLETGFSNKPIPTGWYSSLIQDHAAKFLATENIDIVDRLIELFTYPRIGPEKRNPGPHMPYRELGDVFDRVFHRYAIMGNFQDLDRALRIYEEFESYLIIKDSYMPILLYGMMSDATGDTDYTNRALWLAEQTTVDHAPNIACFADRQCVCINTAFEHQRRKFGLAKNVNCLHKGIALAEGFIAEGIHDVKTRFYVESELADFLLTRGKHGMSASNSHRANGDLLRAKEDLHRARILMEYQLEQDPKVAMEAPDNSLTDIYEALYALTAERQYIDKAINTFKEHSRSRPHQQALLSHNCYKIGRLLLEQDRLCSDTKNLVEALDYFKRGCDDESGNLEARIFCAIEAAEIEENSSHWKEASSLYQQTIHLIRSFNLRYMKNHDKQRKFSQFGRVATSGAAAMLNAGGSPSEALWLLESGRDLLASSLMELRSDVSDLQTAYPTLAKKFIALRDELDAAGDGGAAFTHDEFEPNWTPDEGDRRDADRRFRKLVHRIKQLPGFEAFLPAISVDTLTSGAQRGPVVVLNSSTSRCDAFLVTADEVKVLTLSIKGRDVSRKVAELQASGVSYALLKWLWGMVASPVLEALGYTQVPRDSIYPRIWWVPTGYFSLLPIHAAGKYGSGSTDTVMDRVMSSYATSIKSLIYGQQRNKRNLALGDHTEKNQVGSFPSINPGITHAVLISMATTPSLGQRFDLPFAENEADEVKRLMVSLNLEVAEPSPYRQPVLEEFRRSQVFHFAGHGNSNATEPSASSILLKDWESTPLTTGDIRSTSLTLAPPFLAYLSACSTGENAQLILVDENIHLISSFRLAGFRHVIGSLWEVKDEYCVDVAKVFYETLLDEGITDDAVCLGLHRATKALRSKVITSMVKLDPSSANSPLKDAQSMETTDVSSPAPHKS